MKSLQESLLDDEDILMDKSDMHIQVKKWLEDNSYDLKIKNYKINNDNTIDCDSVDVWHRGDFEEFPVYIKFNKVGNFHIDGVQHLKSTRGFPIICDKIFIKEAYFLEKIDIPTEKINDALIIVDCPALEEIRTKTKSVDLLRLWNLPKLENLEHITKSVRSVELHSLSKIKSLKGLPNKINVLEIMHCRNLTSLDGCPKHINGLFAKFGVNDEFIDKLKDINNIKD